MIAHANLPEKCGFLMCLEKEITYQRSKLSCK